jgi:hypothetical protein
MYDFFSEFGFLGICFYFGIVITIFNCCLYFVYYVIKRTVFAGIISGDSFKDKVAKAIQSHKNTCIHKNIILNKVNPATFWKASPREQLIMAEEEIEADMVAVNKKGIFCFICNVSNGKVKGKSSTSIWTVVRPDVDKQIQSPFISNDRVVQAIKKMGYHDVFNIVCTRGDYIYTYAGVDRTSNSSLYHSFLRNKDKTAIVKLGYFSKGIKQFFNDLDTLPDAFTDSQISEINGRLKELEATKKEHRFHMKLLKSKTSNL